MHRIMSKSSWISKVSSAGSFPHIQCLKTGLQWAKLCGVETDSVNSFHDQLHLHLLYRTMACLAFCLSDRVSYKDGRAHYIWRSGWTWNLSSISIFWCCETVQGQRIKYWSPSSNLNVVWYSCQLLYLLLLIEGQYG